MDPADLDLPGRVEALERRMADMERPVSTLQGPILLKLLDVVATFLEAEALHG